MTGMVEMLEGEIASHKEQVAILTAENDQLRAAVEEWAFRYYWRAEGMRVDQARIHARAAMLGRVAEIARLTTQV